MKRFAFFLTVALIVSLTVFCGMAFSITTLSFDPVTQTITDGGTASVNLDITLDSGTALGGYDLVVNWNDLILGFTNAIPGSSPAPDIFDATGPGQVELTATYFTGATGMFTLATLNFGSFVGSPGVTQVFCKVALSLMLSVSGFLFSQPLPA